jgi:dTDP-D-glucose 4,6-dehydratase
MLQLEEGIKKTYQWFLENRKTNKQTNKQIK